MSTKRYLVMPGVYWVAGRPTPEDRTILLSAEEALFDLLLGRIALAGSQPVDPVDPALEESDVLLLRRGGLEHRVVVDDLLTFLQSKSVGGASIGLSTTVFATGTAKDAILASIAAPDGWTLDAETTFGGRIKVVSRQLLAATALNFAATGSARLRATSPDGTSTVTRSFALSVAGAPVLDTRAPVVSSPTTYSIAENVAFEATLAADEDVSWAKIAGADAALFTLDGAKLSLAARDFETPADADANNVYRVNLTATDLAGNVTNHTVDVTVTNVLEGTLPTLTPTSATITNTTAPGTVVLDLPAKAEGEARAFLSGSPLAADSRFAFSTAGKLVVGVSTVPASNVAGTIRQSRGSEQVDTVVTITVTDVTSDTPPAVPTYEMAQTSYSLGSANHLEAADQNGIKLPAGASALPAVDADWVQWLFFAADEMLQQGAAATYVIASKGTTGHAPGGGSQTGLNIRAGIGTTGQDAFSVGLAANNSALRSFFPDLIRSPAIERGAAHLVVFGQKGKFPFWSLVRVSLDGRVDPVVIHSQVGAANDGTNSWKYGSNGTTAQYASGAYDFLSGMGGNVDTADGGNRRGAGGTIGQYVNVWGSFPFASGAPDADVLKAIASGTVDPSEFAGSISGTLRYANHMRGPADLAADTRGAITTSASEIGLNANCKPAAVSALRRPPQIRLRAYGDGFVLPMGANKQGSVPFRGTFTGSAAADSFEGRLVRVDTGAVLVDWTGLASTIDNTAKTFVGALSNVPAGVAFRREVRWKRRTALVYRDGDRLALGVVLFDVGQSQLAYQAYASAANDAGSGVSLVPSSDANRWMSVIKQAWIPNAQGQANPFWAAALFRPYAAGQHGDGNIATYEQIRRTLGVPVMFIDSATPGTHPNRWLSDRQTFSYSGFGALTPDGTTTVFSFTPISSSLRQDTDTSAPASCVPGSFQLTVGSVSITDDGAGNLTGSGITAGTINYQTGAIANLTFASAPASGAAISGSFKFFAVTPESAVLPQNGGMSMWGDTTQPLDSSYKRGRVMLHLTRLRGIAPSLYRVFWFTSFSAATQAQVSSIFDRLRAKFDAAFPAGASVPMGVILPGREVAGADGAGSKLVNSTHRAALAGKTGFAILGDALDFEIANNSGPHQDPALSRSFGERLGAAVASAHVNDWSANGPIITAAKYTDANRTAIEVTFALSAGTGLTSADGSTTGITGFAVGPSGSSETAWDRTGFTAAITAANKVTLTKSSGSWTASQRLAYANGAPIATGTSSTKAADNASLLKMLSDNDNAYGGGTKFTARAGNVARMNPGVVIADAS